MRNCSADHSREIDRIILRALKEDIPYSAILETTGLRMNALYKRVERLRARGLCSAEGMKSRRRPPDVVRGEMSPAAKLTMEDVRAMRALLAEGFPQAACAAIFGMSPMAVSHIARGHSYREAE